MTTAPAPIRIGYCLSLTGSLAGNSRSARLAHEIWREDLNGQAGFSAAPLSSSVTTTKETPTSFPGSTSG